tara:strand:- start:50 stop:319 length:270 start_codon:yes stop_codon:yes gene_type:complete
MAIRRERPGTWILKNNDSSPVDFVLDNDRFQIQGSSILTMDARISLVYDDTNLSTFRTPPEPQAVVSNVGDRSVQKTSMAPRISIREVY